LYFVNTLLMGSDPWKDDPRKELYGNLCRQIKSRYERARPEAG
jgi:hypothetical protein